LLGTRSGPSTPIAGSSKLMPETNANTVPSPNTDRFAFGRNWSSFLYEIDESGIESVQRALRDLLQVTSLAGKRFLDVGCGSGLSSLAARRLGAQMMSFTGKPRTLTATAHIQ
jgi:hypothetical protein